MTNPVRRIKEWMNYRGVSLKELLMVGGSFSLLLIAPIIFLYSQCVGS